MHTFFFHFSRRYTFFQELYGGGTVIDILQDIYCLDADGALFDAALLSAVAAFSRCKFYLQLLAEMLQCYLLLL